jgi:ABC-type multidrug transport system fused ATPase/permease subunit
MRFIMALPRYVLEVAMVIGGAMIVAVLALTQNTQQAFASLALFLAATSRVVPSLLRLNSARVNLHNQVGRAQRTVELVDYLDEHGEQPHVTGAASSDDHQRVTDPEPSPRFDIEVQDLCVRYPSSRINALTDVSFTVPQGSSVALVGPSGAGKSTLADAILGVISPLSGSVTIDGIPSKQMIASLPGRIAYVPQDVALVHGTVRENVALALPPDLVSDDRIWEVLAQAQLDEFIRQREGLETIIGERGVRLSGGQQQRLGLARALYSGPHLIVLDEATSALDAETERLITDMMRDTSHGMTSVTVAHRLATVRHVDLVVYLQDGYLVAKGSFEEVRRAVPDFDHQARLLGL